MNRPISHLGRGHASNKFVHALITLSSIFSYFADVPMKFVPVLLMYMWIGLLTGGIVVMRLLASYMFSLVPRPLS